MIDPTKIQAGPRLDAAFYQRSDVVLVARELLGKTLVTRFDGVLTAGRIAEVEAYRAPDDRASHAWNGRRTARTEVMFQAGGRAYVYLCYGIHHLFNVVTGQEGEAHAVLIRGIEPLLGLEHMLERRKAKRLKPSLSNGPGALSQALGLHVGWTGQSLLTPDTPVWIEDPGTPLDSADIAVGPRIGVEYAGESAAWPWRFWIRDSAFARQK